MTGLYMQANGSSNLQLQEQKYSVLQFFSVEDAGDGKFYLKSESGANKYVNASGWNAVVGSGDSKTPYTIALVNGETDVYTLEQSFSSYTGKIGADANTAGTSLYCNKGEGNNAKWQFEAVESPEVCTFDPAKTYRIKSEYSGLYMQVTNYTTSGTTEGAFQLKDKSIVAEGQKFMFEAADGEKYYLKTVKEGTTYYVNQGSWNFHAGAEATTPFTIAVVEGHTAVYSLHQTLNAGYAGNDGNAFADGTKIYCNAPTLNGNTIWSFEEVVAESTNLYALKSPTGTYFNFTVSGNTVASFQSAPSYLYMNPSDNAYTFQSLEDETIFIGSTHSWNVTTDESLWTVSDADENGMVLMSRATGSGNLGHDGNTNVGTGIFTNVGSGCFKWQLIPAYPITIIYKNSNDEELETVKAATIAGTGYSFTVDTKGGTLVSCVADKGTMTEADGTYSFDAVNGATTVTVTLEEPEVPTVFNPTPGKAYALKVKDQELYLNIRTLGIDDPNTAGSNNISLSARPFAAIYFEAGSTEGTWKMKNVNGKYVGVPGKGWNPMICDTPHDWTIVLENGVVTIAREAGKFVNANDGAVAAGNPLYCDKGTALQFELFDYDDVNFVTGNGTEGTIQVKEIHEEGLTKIPLGASWRLTMEVESDGSSYNQWGSSILAVAPCSTPLKQCM